MSTPTRKTILLVEDEAIIALAEKQMLQEHGYAVVTAAMGPRSLARSYGNRNCRSSS